MKFFITPTIILLLTLYDNIYRKEIFISRSFMTNYHIVTAKNKNIKIESKDIKLISISNQHIAEKETIFCAADFVDIKFKQTFIAENSIKTFLQVLISYLL
jgi:hypothetical protein